MYFLLYLSKSMETVRFRDLTDFCRDDYLEGLERHFLGFDFWELQEVCRIFVSSDLFRAKYCDSRKHLLMKL